MILERLKKLWRKPPCEHDWVMEKPSTDVGGSLQIWDGPFYDYCTKCGKKRIHPECQHDWQPAEDDGKGIIANDRKMVLVAICSVCGAKSYERPE